MGTKSYQIFLDLFLVFGLIGMIRDNGPAGTDEMYFMHVNVINDGEDDLEELRVRVLIYDLGIVFQSNSFDVDDNEKDGKFIFWDVPEGTNPGTYWARITVSNDDEKDVKHRLITVV